VLATAIKQLLVNGLQLKSCVIVNKQEGEEFKAMKCKFLLASLF
jgi:hypothetical protein